MGVERYRSVDGIGVGINGEGLGFALIDMSLVRVGIRESFVRNV